LSSSKTHNNNDNDGEDEDEFVPAFLSTPSHTTAGKSGNDNISSSSNCNNSAYEYHAKNNGFLGSVLPLLPPPPPLSTTPTTAAMTITPSLSAFSSLSLSSSRSSPAFSLTSSSSSSPSYVTAFYSSSSSRLPLAPRTKSLSLSSSSLLVSVNKKSLASPPPPLPLFPDILEDVVFSSSSSSTNHDDVDEKDGSIDEEGLLLVPPAVAKRASSSSLLSSSTTQNISSSNDASNNNSISRIKLQPNGKAVAAVAGSKSWSSAVIGPSSSASTTMEPTTNSISNIMFPSTRYLHPKPATKLPLPLSPPLLSSSSSLPTPSALLASSNAHRHYTDTYDYATTHNNGNRGTLTGKGFESVPIVTPDKDCNNSNEKMTHFDSFMLGNGMKDVVTPKRTISSLAAASADRTTPVIATTPLSNIVTPTISISSSSIAGSGYREKDTFTSTSYASKVKALISSSSSSLSRARLVSPSPPQLFTPTSAGCKKKVFVTPNRSSGLKKFAYSTPPSSLQSASLAKSNLCAPFTPTNKKGNLMKTEFCKFILKNQRCKFGSLCNFAHSEREMNYKTLFARHDAGLLDKETLRTRPCFDFVATGSW
jgi:hypothetical protein